MAYKWVTAGAVEIILANSILALLVMQRFGESYPRENGLHVFLPFVGWILLVLGVATAVWLIILHNK